MEVKGGDIWCIPQLIFVVDCGRYFPVALTIEGNNLMDLSGVSTYVSAQLGRTLVEVMGLG